jgi:hypothetical protein
MNFSVTLLSPLDYDSYFSLSFLNTSYSSHPVSLPTDSVGSITRRRGAAPPPHIAPCTPHSHSRSVPASLSISMSASLSVSMRESTHLYSPWNAPSICLSVHLLIDSSISLLSLPSFPRTGEQYLLQRSNRKYIHIVHTHRYVLSSCTDMVLHDLTAER